MKALLISDLPDSDESLSTILKEYNFDLIHYRSPVKALDNLEEIKPDAVLVNTSDFPRHWKVITQHIRWDKTKEKVIIVLLTEKNFQQEEADKALKTGVQGIIELKEAGFVSILEDLKTIFSRYNYLPKKDRFIKKDLSKSVKFLFTNPINEIIITGTVKEITTKNLIFLPDMPASISNLEEGKILSQCSLQINEKLVTPKCKIESKNLALNLSFIDYLKKKKNISILYKF